MILAGGTGSRAGMSTPKQFFKVAGRMVIEHTVEAFERHPLIDEIAIVSNPHCVSEVENLVLRNGWKKVRKILKGGKERYHSSLSAIQAYPDSGVNLIFHDAVRPLVSARIIREVVEALTRYRAVDVALPSVDTVICTEGDFIESIPDRSRLMRGQTPQAFHGEVIRKAYEIALTDPLLQVTDDCGIVRKYLPDEPIFIVRGEEANMKLTYKEDIYLLDRFFQFRRETVNGGEINPSDLAGKVAVVFGGSSGIGEAIVGQLRRCGSKVYSFSRREGATDITRLEQVEKTLASVHRLEGKVDFVINTAGILHKQPLTATAYETIREGIDINYLGTVHVALAAWPYLKESRGKLLFFASSSYTLGRAYYSIYSSTKAAVVNFVQAIAQEWEGDGITVNCINPERTRTPMRTASFGTEPEESLLTPERVAEESVRALLSDATGQVIDVKRSYE